MKWSNALALLAIAVSASRVHAAAGDYAFEPVKAEVQVGSGSELAVRLVHKPDGKPVEAALIVKTRLDMSPENMEAMTSKVEPVPPSEPGIYRFKADLNMAGRWALRLMAKLQGEPETVIGTTIFTAKE